MTNRAHAGVDLSASCHLLLGIGCGSDRFLRRLLRLATTVRRIGTGNLTVGAVDDGRRIAQPIGDDTTAFGRGEIWSLLVTGLPDHYSQIIRASNVVRGDWGND